MTQKKLRELLKKAGMKASDVLRKGEKTAKELNITVDTPESELVRLMIEHPQLLQRPIVEYGDRAVLARPIDKAIELIRG
ncbi:MAG: ArsC/Spx/MgsR family protein [Pyrinomonadaceae bacterium]